MPFDVLVVDDDPWFRAVAARLLKSAGFHIAGEADTARRAVAAVIDLSPAAVLLDVGLPDGDGVSVATELSALATPPLIVLTSSDPDAVTHDLARRSGAEGFIPKGELTDAKLQALFGAA
jgi:DNA-binding NarL/FixJ family response regulator